MATPPGPPGVEGRVIALERKVYGELAYWETVELLEATRKAPLKIATFDC